MESVMNVLERAVGELLGRAGGPMHLRLFLQPLMATFFAVRAGLRDAREGKPAFLWEVVTNPVRRRELLRSGWKDVSKVFIAALVLDTVYQLVALHAIRPVQTLIVAVTLALVPYVVIRGPVTRIARVGRGKRGGPVAAPPAV